VIFEGRHITQYCSIDELLQVDHKMRVIWDAVCQMDLSAFIEPIKARQHGPKAERPARVSNTDPETRNMKMPNGGFNPAHNVQFASDPISRRPTQNSRNAVIRTNRGMATLSVRGIGKAEIVKDSQALRPGTCLEHFTSCSSVHSRNGERN